MTDAPVDSPFAALFQSDVEWWIDRLDGAPGWPRSLLVGPREEMSSRDAAQVGELPEERVKIYWNLIGERPPHRADQCRACRGIRYASAWLQAKRKGSIGDRPIDANTEADYRRRLAA